MYPSRNIIRMIKYTRLRYAGDVNALQRYSGAFKILIGIPIGNKYLRRPGLRWEDNIRS